MHDPVHKPALVRLSALFFVVAGLLEVLLPIATDPGGMTFVKVWEAMGRAIFDFLLAFGLWRRIALCRSIAMVYCLAALATYAAVLVLAYIHAPFRFPESIVMGSLFEVPSCAVLYPYLRSAEASVTFHRPLFTR
jgi:hypothetical protein